MALSRPICVHAWDLHHSWMCIDWLSHICSWNTKAYHVKDMEIAPCRKKDASFGNVQTKSTCNKQYNWRMFLLVKMEWNLDSFSSQIAWMKYTNLEYKSFACIKVNCSSGQCNEGKIPKYMAIYWCAKWFDCWKVIWKSKLTQNEFRIDRKWNDGISENLLLCPRSHAKAHSHSYTHVHTSIRNDMARWLRLLTNESIENWL